MKGKMMKKWLAIVSCVMLLCSLMSVGAAADNGLEIFDGEDVLHIPLAAYFYPYYSELPEGVTEEDLVVSFSNEEIVEVSGEDYLTAMYRAIAVGTTDITVATSDGVYADTVTLVVDEPVPMTSDCITVYTNYRHQVRCLTYTADQSGMYAMTIGSEQMSVIEVYDASFATIGMISSGETVALEGGEMYYICPVVYNYLPWDAYKFSVTYSGEAVETEPSSIVFAQDTFTMSLYDSLSVPSYTFEPGGYDWGYGVTFTVSDESILMVDPDFETLTPLQAGTVTLMATVEETGWSDTITITVTNEPYLLTEEEVLDVSLGSGEMRAVFFVAPRTDTYVFYSQSTVGDPYCVAYDVMNEEEIGYGDDENQYDFSMALELEEGQVVMLMMAAYQSENEFTLSCGAPKAATSVQIETHATLSRQDDTIYVPSGTILDMPDVVFLGGPTVVSEEYILETVAATATPDEYGCYLLQAGQTVTYRVTTDSGLTNTTTIKAIDLFHGDVNIDGDITALDVSMVMSAINGATEFDAATLGAMDVNGDNELSLADAARLFYYVNSVIDTI